MQRIATPHATTNNQFQDANPGAGVKATEFSAAWCNAVQEEIAGVIEASGAALNAGATNQLLQAFINLAHPIGQCLDFDTDALTPGQLYPWQTWIEIMGVVLVGRDPNQVEFSSTGLTGGEKTHGLSVNEMPTHSHPTASFGLRGLAGGSNNVPSTIATSGGQTDTAGGGAPHNNLQPYRVVRMWKRTA